MPHCEFCQVSLAEGEGLKIDLFIGPARAAKLEARYGRPLRCESLYHHGVDTLVHPC